jgi:hypothetical protein
MTATSNVRLKAIKSNLEPLPGERGMRTLWRARLRIQDQKDEFLFRAGDEFESAAQVATELLESSPSCKMVSAQIIAVERIARLWN